MFLIGLFFFLRPHLMTMRSNPDSGGANYVEQVQRFLHMTVDPTRSYYEQATRWLSWYLGWGTLALALIGACWLAYEQVAGHRRVWAPAFLVCFGSAVWVLFAPSITPDHPWADRRFVPVVLPGLVLFALIAIVPVLQYIASRSSRAWSADSSARAVLLGALQGAVGALAVLIVVVPVWTGSRDVIYTKTEVGEPALVHAGVLAAASRRRCHRHRRPGENRVAWNAEGHVRGERRLSRQRRRPDRDVPDLYAGARGRWPADAAGRERGRQGRRGASRRLGPPSPPRRSSPVRPPTRW